MQYTKDIKFGMLQARENEIALRKLSGGNAHLRSCAPYKQHYPSVTKHWSAFHPEKIIVKEDIQISLKI